MMIRKILYISFLVFLIYLTITFVYEALLAQYKYSCGTWVDFCPEITGIMSIEANQHLTLLEIRLGIIIIALSMWCLIGVMVWKK